MPLGPPHSASKFGCMLAITPQRAEHARLLLGHHLQVLEAVAAAGDGGCPVPLDDAGQRVDHRGDRGVADDVKAGGDPRLGARVEVRLDGVAIQVGVAARSPAHPRRAGAATRCASRARRRRTGRPPVPRTPVSPTSVARVRGGGDGLTPVADDLDAVGQRAQFVPVVDAADVGSSALVDRDDARTRRQVERGEPGLAALRGRQQALAAAAPGDARRPSAAAGRRDPPRRQLGHRVAAPSTPQRSARPRGPGRRAGRRPARRVRRSSGGAGRPARLVPPVRPRRGRSGWRRRSRRQPQHVLRESPRAQVEADEASPVAVTWTWLSTNAGVDEPAVEVDHPGVGELLAPDVVGAQPRHDAVGPVADRHCGRVRHGRAVDLAADQQGRQATSGCRGRRAAAPRRVTSTTSPSM